MNIFSKNMLRLKQLSALPIVLLSVLVLLSTSNIQAQNNLQTKKITISFDKTPLSKALNEIEKQTSLLFVYKTTEIDANRQITGKFTDKSVADVLNSILAGTKIEYNLVNNNIVLSPMKATTKSGEKRTISGVVKDSKGEPIVGAGVIIEGTTVGTTTDLGGKFSLNADTDANLLISFIGYNPQNVAIDNRSNIEVILADDMQDIEEVVVIGYGTVKKRDLTGAVSSVKSEDMKSASNSNVGQMLAGKAAGMQVLQNTGQPGGAVNFQIRGATSVNASNDPLFIIDGFPVGSYSETRTGGTYDPGKRSPLNTINPADIESVEILKDASATAIYGARAANGVIIITTKKGKEGKVSVEYSGSYTVQTPSKNYEVLDAYEMRDLRSKHHRNSWLQENKIGIYGNKTEAEINAGGNFYKPVFTAEEIANPQYNTNWLDQVMRNGSINQHNMSVSGGTKDMKYMISGNYFDQKGLMKNENFKRYSTRVNLEQKLWKIAKIGLNTTMSRILSDNSSLGTRNANKNMMGALNTALSFGPDFPIYDDKGNYFLDPANPTVSNPVSLLDIKDNSVIERILGVAFFEIEPIKDLTIRANAGFDRNISKNSLYVPKTTLLGGASNGEGAIAQSDGFDTSFDITATYRKQIGKAHSITAMVGTSYQQFDQTRVNAGNKDFIIDGFGYNNLGAGAFERPTVGSYGEKSQTGSYFARLNYSLLDRYLLTATIRTDGASNFAENKKWGTFPSAALAWRVSDEAFMKGTEKYLSNLKIRVSYGQTGNSSIGYKAFSNFKADRMYYFGSSPTTAVYAAQLTNPNLSWETTTEFNLGVDFGFFNEKLTGSFEYFNKTTSDLLADKALMSYHEVNTIAANIGKTQGKGIELSLKSINFSRSDFTWTTQFTMSRYQDRWLERDPTWKPGIHQKDKDYIRETFKYQSDGLIKPGDVLPHMPGSIPGQVKIVDRDGYAKDNKGNFITDENGRFVRTGAPDGVLNDADLISLGMDGAGYNVGLGNSITYKDFDFSIYFYGMFDRVAYNYANEYIGPNGYTLVQGGNILKTMLNSWRPDNQDTTVPSLFQSNAAPGYMGDYLYEPGWFIRCKNITLGYTLPSKLIRNVGSIRAYIDVQNPFIITKYSGLDPETDGVVGAYPNVRSFSFGLDLKF